MSSCRVTDLRHKEIINSADGCRLGYIDDVEIDTVTANMVSVIIQICFYSLLIHTFSYPSDKVKVYNGSI